MCNISAGPLWEYKDQYEDQSVSIFPPTRKKKSVVPGIAQPLGAARATGFRQAPRLELKCKEFFGTRASKQRTTGAVVRSLR